MMKKYFEINKAALIILFLFHLTFVAQAQYQTNTNNMGTDNYLNPVFAGDHPDGWQFPTERNVIKNHVFFRLKNINNTVDMFYSLDGETWNKIESSVEVSGYHHNVLSGFLSLRIGLCSIGDGKVKFKNFVYQTIK